MQNKSLRWRQLRYTLEPPCRNLGSTLEVSWRQLGGVIMRAPARHLEATERHLGGWRQLRDTLEASRSRPQESNLFLAFLVDLGAADHSSCEKASSCAKVTMLPQNDEPRQNLRRARNHYHLSRQSMWIKACSDTTPQNPYCLGNN